MNERVLTFSEISKAVKYLLKKYNAEYALLFGSYARGEATPQSDIDLVVFGGEKFHGTDIFAFGEEMRAILLKDVDAYEIREVNNPSPLYQSIMKDGVKIA